MLTLALIRSAKGAAKYFTKEDGYYLSELSAKENSMWIGKGAQMLGLTGNISEKQLQDMFDGKLPNGDIIGGKNGGDRKHRAGYDLTFNAPKSVSMLILAGKDQRLYQAHKEAILKTFNYIERACAQAKVYSDGAAYFDNTKNLTAALIPHNVSRAMDMHIHSHLLVMNATHHDEKGWRALASSRKEAGIETNGFMERIYKNQIYYGLIYRSELANKVKELGYEVENVGKNGLWEIKGVSKEALDISSKRRHEIEEGLSKLENKTLRNADIINEQTKSSKPKNINQKELITKWEKELSSVDFDAVQFVKQAEERSKVIGLENGNNTEKTHSTTQLEAGKIPQNAKDAVKDAINWLSQYELKLDYTRIATKALEFSIGKTSHESIVAAIDDAVKNSEIVAINKNASYFVTDKLVNNEKEIMTHVNNGKNAAKPLKIKDNVLVDKTLEKQATEQVINVLKSKDRLLMVNHKNNNLDFIEGIVQAAEQSGKTVRILTPNRIMANNVNDNITGRPQTIWQWLMGQNKPELGDSVAGFNFKYKKEVEAPLLWLRQGRDVIVVESAEKIGNNDMRTLLNLSEKSNAKVVFLNDISAKRGFGAGNPVVTLKQGGIREYTLQEKQNGSDILPELKTINEDDKRASETAKYYSALDINSREDALVVAGSKVHSNELNHAIRNELQLKGDLGRMEYNFTVLNGASLNDVERSLASKYKKGMVVRLFEDRGYIDKTVAEINKERNILTLEDSRGKTFWNPKKSKQDFRVFQSEEIKLAEGDKIIATANMRDRGVKTAQKFTISSIDNGQVRLSGSRNNVNITFTGMQNSHFEYNYATTLQRASKRKVNHVIADMKSYALDKNTLTELKNRSKESLTIFTNNAEKAQKRFGAIPVKMTAAEIVTKAVNIDRTINDKTFLEIKDDIENAMAVLKKGANETAAEKAVNFALEKITSRDAGFLHSTLVAEALAHGLGGNVSVENVTSVVMAKKRSGELIMGNHFDDGTRWTTKEMLALEKNILHNLNEGKDKLQPLLSDDAAKNKLEHTKLTRDQKNACHLITTTKDQFVLVQGYAGTGKTTMFEQVHAITKELKEMVGSNLEVLAVAPTHQAVKELKNRGIKAQTLKSFLFEEQANKSESNKLIILDEASMVSNKDFNEFTDIVRKDGMRAVLSGDIAQHLAIESGKPQEIALRSNILETAYLKENVRQKNPVLKEAVNDVIKGDYEKAFAKVAQENPQDHIKRATGNLLLDTMTSSVIEIDNDKKEHRHLLESTIADDYATRTPEIRDNTVVIIHSNYDRNVVNSLIRSKLKDQGDIAQTGIENSRLVRQGYSDVELRDMKAYQKTDVLKVGKEYFDIIERDDKTKSLLIKDRKGDTQYFYPERHTGQQVEAYTLRKDEIVAGDLIRLTKTDKDRERYANFEYRVESVHKDYVDVSDKESGELKKIVMKSLEDAHWDYAYTTTSYGVQGASKKYAIDCQLSSQKFLSNARAFYIGISRAVEHLTIYTDNKNMLMRRIFGNNGNKLAALEVTGELKDVDESKGHNAITVNNAPVIERRNNNEYGVKSEDKSESLKPQKPYYKAADIESSLKNAAEYVVEKILGDPNQKLSSSYEWRYGSKGSLSIKMSGDKRGLWHNFETNESGNLLKLIQNETSLGFKESLNYAASLLGSSDINSIEPTKRSADAIKVNEDFKPNINNKTKHYAEQLLSESKPIAGTIVERYLKEQRNILNIDSQDIRFHPGVYTGKYEDHKYMPAMLSIGRDKDGNMQCVQATYLDPETADKAKLDVNKRTYSSPIGAPVMLNKASNSDRISYVAEGIETALSIKDAVKTEDVIATLSKSNFMHIEVQNPGQKVVLCLDNDGISAYSDSAIHKAAERLIADGKEVYISMPEQLNNRKTDFNDLAKLSGQSAVYETLNRTISYTLYKDVCDNIKTNDMTAINAIISDIDKANKAEHSIDVDGVLSKNQQQITAIEHSIDKLLDANNLAKGLDTSRELEMVEREIY